MIPIPRFRVIFARPSAIFLTARRTIMGRVLVSAPAIPFLARAPSFVKAFSPTLRRTFAFDAGAFFPSLAVAALLTIFSLLASSPAAFAWTFTFFSSFFALKHRDGRQRCDIRQILFLLDNIFP